MGETAPRLGQGVDQVLAGGAEPGPRGRARSQRAEGSAILSPVRGFLSHASTFNHALGLASLAFVAQPATGCSAD